MTTSALKTAYNALLTKGRLSANPNQAALIARLADLQITLVNSPHPGPAPNGLYIHGGVGTGKSRIADLFATTLPPQISHRRAHFHEFMLDVHARLHRAWSSSSPSGGGGSVDNGDPLATIGRDIVQHESRVLCFDEFQVTDIADAMILQRLFAAVWAAGGVLVATSNRHPDALYENGLNRALFLPFIALLQRRCDLWRLGGDEDYRRIGSEERIQTFFSAADDQGAAGKFVAALRRECRGAEVRERELRVMMGRYLRVRAAEPDTGGGGGGGGGGGLLVHASFAELCETNLGAADYHALCGAASAIFIDGVRPLGRSELDFARRLITLVDVAYEARTRVFLCCSAAEGAGTEDLEGLFREVVVAERERVGVMSLYSGGKGLTTMDVRRGGGASSSMMSTFVGDTEWSATGLAAASLASGGAGETDVVFAVGRAVSRLYEMGSKGYGVKD